MSRALQSVSQIPEASASNIPLKLTFPELSELTTALLELKKFRGIPSQRDALVEAAGQQVRLSVQRRDNAHSDMMNILRCSTNFASNESGRQPTVAIFEKAAHLSADSLNFWLSDKFQSIASELSRRTKGEGDTNDGAPSDGSFLTPERRDCGDRTLDFGSTLEPASSVALATGRLTLDFAQLTKLTDSLLRWDRFAKNSDHREPLFEAAGRDVHWSVPRRDSPRSDILNLLHRSLHFSSNGAGRHPIIAIFEKAADCAAGANDGKMADTFLGIASDLRQKLQLEVSS